MKLNRPLLLISSTSYTPDEDLQLLIDSLTEYANLREKENKLPRLL